nr:MAG TPA: hypothetical protein [Caudoviricetes sp.]
MKTIKIIAIAQAAYWLTALNYQNLSVLDICLLSSSAALLLVALISKVKGCL